jgi:hypothetical protein
MVTVAVGDVDARQPPPPSLDPVGQHVHLVVGGQRVDEDRVVVAVDQRGRRGDQVGRSPGPSVEWVHFKKTVVILTV